MITTAPLLQTTLVILLSLQTVNGWGGDNSCSDTSIFGNALSRSWLSDSSSMSIKLEGCTYGYASDNEDAGCMENESEDGTYYWYMMANCLRAQAVYSVYASSGNSAGCNSGNFQESFVTTTGASEFIYYLQQYDSNGYLSNNDDGYSNDGLPQCEQADGYYIGVGCGDDGSFILEYYDDQYCQSPSGKTYDKLSSLNNALKNYKNCVGVDMSNNNDGGDGYSSLANALISNSDGCSSLDSGLCTDSSAMKNRRSNSNSHLPHSRGFGQGKTWMTKLKYVAGGLLLLASFVMFTGILFTNRRRRRALMQRKYRQRRGDDRSRRSKSKSRSGSKSKSRSGSSRKSRSRSKPRTKSTPDEDAGVFT